MAEQVGRRAADVIRLTSAGKRKLQRVARAQDVHPRARLRALIVLMSAAGQSGSQVATILGVTPRTVRNARMRWRRGALAALAEGHRAGRPPCADSRYLARLARVVERDPREFGFVFTRWTAPRLAEYLARETGIRLTPDWVSELLRRRGFVWRRTKRTIRNLADPAEIERAKQRLRRLKKGPCAAMPRTISGSPTA